MPIQQEEARAKLSLDTSDLAKGRRDIDNFGKESHKSFLHATSGARGFHKLLHEVGQQGGIMGQLLQVAISPIGGAFLLATTGIAAATNALEKFNKRLDATAEINAKGISSPMAILQAVTKRKLDIAKGRSDFISSEQSKGNGPLSGLESVETALGNVENSPEKTELQRAALQRTKANLMKQGVALDQGVTAAEKDAANPKVAAGIASAKQTAELLRATIGAIESRKSELQTSASEDEEIAHMNPVRRAYRATAKLMGGEMPGSAAAELRLLESYKKQLIQVEERGERLNATDAKSLEIAKQRREELGRVLDAYREVDKKLQAMPLAPLVAGIAPQSNTGGIAYRPLESKGGIAYRGLPGSIGYQSPAATPPPTQEQRQAQVVIDLVAKYLQGGGIPVQGKE